MIRRLRLKFIAVVLAVVLAIITILGIIINIAVYHGTYSEYDKAMDGFYEYFEDLEPFSDEKIGISKPTDDSLFFVRKPSGGDFLDCDLNSVTNLEYEQVLELSHTAINSYSDHGLAEIYRYGVYEDASGNQTVFFQNVIINISFLNELKSMTILVSILIFIITGIITVPISRRIVSMVEEQINTQNEFITNASHDLKTPMAVISANMDVLSISNGDNQWIQSTKKQVKYLTKLVNHMITTSKLNEKGFSTPFESFDFSHAAQDVADQFTELAASRNLIYTHSIETDIIYYGSEIYIRQLLTILCENAITYSEENGRVSISLRKQKNSIILTVFNTRDPAAPLEINRIFDRFYRGDRSRSSDRYGNGLGLSMAKSITEMHGGTITAQCKTADSITFNVILKG